MLEASVLKIDVFGGYQGGPEPWECTTSIRIDRDGFHETHPVGRSGDRAPLGIAEVADSLMAEFEPNSLLQLMNYVEQLHEMLLARSSAAKSSP